MSKPNEVSKEDVAASIHNPKSTERSALVDFLQNHIGVPHEPRAMRIDSAMKDQLTQKGVLPKFDLSDSLSRSGSVDEKRAVEKVCGVADYDKANSKLPDVADLLKQIQGKVADGAELSKQPEFGKVGEGSRVGEASKVADGSSISKSLDGAKIAKEGELADGAELSKQMRLGKMPGRREASVDVGKFVSNIRPIDE